MNQDGWEFKPVGWEVYDDEPEGDPTPDITSPREDAEILQPTERKEYDVIFVLAGGLDDKGHCHPWVKRRLDLSVKVLEKHPNASIVCLGGGTYHKPPYLNYMQFVVHESTACADYLMRHHNVPGSKILKEWASFDTIANAFFALTNHAIPRKWTRVMVITSNFHMLRSRAIFEWVFRLDTGREYKIDYVAHSDRGLDQDVIRARTERELASMNNLQRNIERIRTFDQFHSWFFTEHRAYNCILPEHDEHREVIDEHLKKSY